MYIIYIKHIGRSSIAMTKETLRQIFKMYNISQAEVAKRMGISYQALYSRIEAKDISISTLTGIAQALNISLSQLCASVETQAQEELSQLDEISALRRENKILRQMIADKTAIIELLRSTKKSEV